MKTSHFITSLRCEQADYAHWKLTQPLKYQDGRGDIHVVHKGFISDFATIPPLDFIAGLALCLLTPFYCGFAWLHWVAPMLWLSPVVLAGFFVVLNAHWFNDNELLDAPAVLHDDGYRKPRLGSWTSRVKMKLYWDRLLLEAMLSVRRNNMPRPLKWWQVGKRLVRTFGRPDTIPLWVAWSVYLAVSVFGWFAYFYDGRYVTGYHDK